MQRGGMPLHKHVALAMAFRAVFQGVLRVFVAESVHIAPVFFGGPGTDAGGDGFGLWCHIRIKRLRLGCGTASLGQRLNFHDANLAALGKGQHIARRHLGRGFSNLDRIHPHMPVRDLAGGKAPGFEEPGLPQPLVQAVFRRGAVLGRLGYDLSFNAARTAKGLSGSTLLDFSGRAE